MRNLLKLELKRAFLGKWFILALIIGLIISISHFIMDINTFTRITPEIIKPMVSPSGLLASWMGGNNYNFQGYLFYLLLPILAVMPYVYSYYQDKKLGFIKNILTRTKPTNYYIAKWIAVFLSAGTVIVIPLIVNLLLFMTILPSINPQISSFYFTIYDSSMFANLFINQPFLYILFYFIIAFIFAGLIGTIGLLVVFITDYLFIVLLSPFIFYIFSSSILEMVRLEKFSPNYFLKPSFGQSAISIIIIEGLILFTISFLIFILHGKRRLDF